MSKQRGELSLHTCTMLSFLFIQFAVEHACFYDGKPDPSHVVNVTSYTPMFCIA